jgi:peptidoglycan hydrolase FlgJ
LVKTSFDPKILAAPQTPNGPAKGADAEKLRETCQQFEAIFVQQMLKEMRGTVPEGGLLPRNMGQDYFQEMMDAEVAKAAAIQGHFGIGEALFRQLQPPAPPAADPAEAAAPPVVDESQP